MKKVPEITLNMACLATVRELNFFVNFHFSFMLTGLILPV